ncbi:MAG: hypothetical protein JWL73_2664 [Actinomycetia bacterium]|nr:hypothetical protein [Actinomycetes bacterium]
MTRRRSLAVALAGVLVVAVGLAGYLVLRPTGSSGPACHVAGGGRSYGLDREQAANAITITAAANALGLPHHAVTIAIAAALQESQLHNLRYGDRDSLGLFQQRPSQGWGTPTQILTPSLAASSFLRALARLDQWQTMPVSDAAQLVQHSATPSAYAKWENEARAIARATTGELPGALTCAPQ